MPTIRVRAMPLVNLADYFDDQDYPPSAIRQGAQGDVAARLYIDADGVVAGCMIARSSGSAVLDESTCRILRVRPRFVPARGARGARGAPVPDIVRFRVRWELAPVGPDDSPLQTLGSTPDETVSGAPDSGFHSYIDDRPPTLSRLLQHVRAHPTRPIAAWITPADYPAAAWAARREGKVNYALTIGATGRVTRCTASGGDQSSDLALATCRLLRTRARYSPAHGLDSRAVAGEDNGLFVWRLRQARPAADSDHATVFSYRIPRPRH